MALIVAKFGGTSVGDIDRIKNAASKVAQEIRRGNKVVVVVSAMAGVTDQMINYCHSVTPVPRRANWMRWTSWRANILWLDGVGAGTTGDHGTFMARMASAV